MTEKQNSSLEYPLEVSVLPQSGQFVKFAPNAEDLDVFAEQLGVMSITSLVAELRLSRFQKDGVRMHGELDVILEQSCVVTLEPVLQEISVSIDRQFLPYDKLKRRNEEMLDDELVIDAEAEDEPEELVGNRLDLWQILGEEIILELDPFPRSPEAGNAGSVHREFAEDKKASTETGEEDTHKPFADLKSLLSEKKSDN